MFNGKIHYKLPCSIAMLNYQRVDFSTFSHGLFRKVTPVTGEVSRTMRFCFDLDGTLVHPNESGGVEPVPNAIELVRQLHKAKHTIIITTSAWEKHHGSYTWDVGWQWNWDIGILRNFDDKDDEKMLFREFFR